MISDANQGSRAALCPCTSIAQTLHFPKPVVNFVDENPQSFEEKFRMRASNNSNTYIFYMTLLSLIPNPSV